MRILSHPAHSLDVFSVKPLNKWWRWPLQGMGPARGVRLSCMAAMDEGRAEGGGAPGDNSTAGREIRDYGPRWADPELFEEYARHLRDQAVEDSPRPEGLVPSTTLWWADGDEYLGRIDIRHRLTQHLLDYGGHIGYDVRPSARRRGHATAMVARAGRK